MTVATLHTAGGDTVYVSLRFKDVKGWIDLSTFGVWKFDWQITAYVSFMNGVIAPTLATPMTSDSRSPATITSRAIR